MNAKVHLKEHLITDQELPYTLFSIIGSTILLFFIPVAIGKPFQDYLSASLYAAGIVLYVLGKVIYRYSLFLSVLIVTFVHNFLIFWVCYRYGKATGAILFYFPFMVAFLYIFLTKQDKFKTAAKVFINILFFVLSVGFTDMRSKQFAFIDDTLIQNIYTVCLVFSIIATLSILIALYRHFINLHEKVIEEQQKQHKMVLREIDRQHEKEEYALLLSIRDDISQTLVTSRMYLQMMQTKEPMLLKADEGIKNAIDSLNNISLELSPSMLVDFGFAQGISVYAELLSKKYNIPVEIVLEEDSDDLPDIDRLSLFRIIHQGIAIIAAGNPASLKVRINCQNKIWVSFSYAAANVQFVEQFNEPQNQDLSKRLDYYNATIKEEPGKIELLLDLKNP